MTAMREGIGDGSAGPGFVAQHAFSLPANAMVLNPPRRTFSEKERRKGPKDVDAGDRAQRLRIWVWSVAAGLPFGGGVGLLLGHLLLGLLLGPLVIFAIVAVLTGYAGRGASVLYMPSGATTPRRREYSRAKALEIRGDHDGAIRAYEEEILDRPEDAEPYVRIARIFRDHLGDFDAAMGWFRRAQREARPTTGEAIRIHRELAELLLYRRKEPRKAAPELARLAEGFPGTEDGRWAARELAAIKEELAREMGAAPRNPMEERTDS